MKQIDTRLAEALDAIPVQVHVKDKAKWPGKNPNHAEGYRPGAAKELATLTRDAVYDRYVQHRITQTEYEGFEHAWFTMSPYYGAPDDSRYADDALEFSKLVQAAAIAVDEQRHATVTNTPQPVETGLPAKPFTPGAPITWRHVDGDGGEIVRTGIVWDRAPSVDGAVIVCWVTPDEPLPNDLYSVIAVGKAYRRQTVGQYGSIAKGDLFSTNRSGHPIAQLMRSAFYHAASVRYERRGAA
jgi:hypothetical protein